MARGKTDNTTMRVADVIALMERIAPPQLVEEWDNCGLQVGSYQWPVKKIWIALDPLVSVVKAAAQEHVDMVVTHHPLLFRPLRKVDVDDPTGSILQMAIQSQIALYAAHTNLDSSLNGVNETLSRRLGLVDGMPLIPAAPAIQLDVGATGMGRIGNLEHPMTLEQLAAWVKSRLNLEVAKFCGDPGARIQRVAICSGAGSSLLSDFLASDAQVFISGDLRYHDARTIEDAGRFLIDAGHFPSEQIIVEVLTRQLIKMVETDGRQVIIEPCSIEKDPFRYL